MHYVDLVAVLAVAQFVFFGVLVGQARGRYGVKAPAVTGHELFERTYRVQMNTLELLVAFLPLLFIAGKYWPQAWVAAVGAVFLMGRFDLLAQLPLRTRQPWLRASRFPCCR